MAADLVQEALSSLDQVVQDLTEAYPRPALAGRLEQITTHVTGLRSLIEQLPDEEMREADFGRRLLAAHDAGFLDPDRADHTQNFSHDAVERLRYEIAARQAAPAPAPAGKAAAS